MRSFFRNLKEPLLYILLDIGALHWVYSLCIDPRCGWGWIGRKRADCILVQERRKQECSFCTCKPGFELRNAMKQLSVSVESEWRSWRSWVCLRKVWYRNLTHSRNSSEVTVRTAWCVKWKGVEGTADKQEWCTRSNIVNKKMYIFDDTSRNAYTRGCEHTKSLAKKEDDSVLHKHVMELHQGNTDTPKFSMKVVSRHSTALDRHTTEAVRISSAGLLMNSNQEFGHIKRWRFTLEAA